MEYGGKITQRFWMPKQLGVDDLLAHEIRATASADRRELRDQIRFLIELGLEHRRYRVGNEHLSQSAHVDAQMRTSGKKPPTRARTDAHSEAHGLPNQLLLPNTAGPIPTRKKRTA